jgi:hypothetical protein
MGLTILQKRQLADQATWPNVRAKDIANINQINYNTLKKYRYRADKGLPLFEKDGRPLKLDEDSNNFILRYMSETAGWDRYSLYPLIKQESLETSRRRYPTIEPRRMSKSSVRRHALRLIAAFENNPIDFNLGDEGDYWETI